MASLAEKEVDETLEIALEFADQSLTLTEMIYHISLEAHRIQGEQRARLLAGLALGPDPDQIGRIARSLTVMKYLERVQKYQSERRRND